MSDDKAIQFLRLLADQPEWHVHACAEAMRELLRTNAHTGEHPLEIGQRALKALFAASMDYTNAGGTVKAGDYSLTEIQLLLGMFGVIFPTPERRKKLIGFVVDHLENGTPMPSFTAFC